MNALMEEKYPYIVVAKGNQLKTSLCLTLALNVHGAVGLSGQADLVVQSRQCPDEENVNALMDRKRPKIDVEMRMI